MIPAETPTPKTLEDLRAVMQQNEMLKTLIGYLVIRQGGHVTIGPTELAKAATVDCRTVEGPLRSYKLTAKFL